MVSLIRFFWARRTWLRILISFYIAIRLWTYHPHKSLLLTEHSIDQIVFHISPFWGKLFSVSTSLNFNISLIKNHLKRGSFASTAQKKEFLTDIPYVSGGTLRSLMLIVVGFLSLNLTPFLFFCLHLRRR